MKKSKFNIVRKIVLTLTHQLIKLNGYTFGEAQRKAWNIYNTSTHDLGFILWTSTKGETKKRVIYNAAWTNFYEVKGTGKPRPEGLELFVDVAKHLSGKYATISAYKNSIIERF